MVRLNGTVEKVELSMDGSTWMDITEHVRAIGDLSVGRRKLWIEFPVRFARELVARLKVRFMSQENGDEE